MQNESLSDWVKDAAGGSRLAEEKLAAFFLDKALEATAKKLTLTAEDREDVALSAVKSFCFGIRRGGISYQGDGQLFALLYKIIDTKIRKLWQYHLAQKRDIRKREPLDGVENEQLGSYPLGRQALPADSIHVNLEEQAAVDSILSELQTDLHSLFAELLNELDEHPRKLLLTMLETDASSEELAAKIGRSVASVERYRSLIRHKIGMLAD